MNTELGAVALDDLRRRFEVRTPQAEQVTVVILKFNTKRVLALLTEGAGELALDGAV